MIPCVTVMVNCVLAVRQLHQLSSVSQDATSKLAARVIAARGIGIVQPHAVVNRLDLKDL